MTGTQMTEAPHNTRKAALEYVALASIAVLAMVVYLWLSFSPPSKEEVRETPWDFKLTSVSALSEDDLTAVRELDAVGRVEQSGTELTVWISGMAADRAAYEHTADTAEEELTALADEREAARVARLLRELHTEPDEAALAELTSLREKLDAGAQRLAARRQELDEEQATLQKRQAELDAVRAELNRDGHALDEAEASISADSGNTDRDELRRHNELRDAWFAGGEGYLDTFTLYSQEKARLDKSERAYAADLSAWNAENERMEELRRVIETEPDPPKIEDCTWHVERNPHAAEIFDTPAEKSFSPLRLAMQMLFLGIAAMAAWLFFAILLSNVAGSIVKPRPTQEHADKENKAVCTEEKEAVAAATE